MYYALLAAASAMFAAQFMFNQKFREECGSDLTASLLFTVYTSLFGFAAMFASGGIQAPYIVIFAAHGGGMRDCEHSLQLYEHKGVFKDKFVGLFGVRHARGHAAAVSVRRDILRREPDRRKSAVLRNDNRIAAAHRHGRQRRRRKILLHIGVSA